MNILFKRLKNRRIINNQFFKKIIMIAALLHLSTVASTRDIINTYDTSAINIFLVKLNNKWGLISATGNKILQEKYDSIILTKNKKIAYPIQNKKFGLVSFINGELITPKYDYIGEFHKGYAEVVMAMTIMDKKHYHHGIIDSLGNEIISPEFKFISNYNSNYALLAECNQENDNCNYIDDKKFTSNGTSQGDFIPWEWISPNQSFILKSYDSKFKKRFTTYSNLSINQNTLTAHKWISFDKAGKKVGQERIGIIDFLGNIIIPFNYIDIYSFLSGDQTLYSVYDNKRSALLRSNGSPLYPFTNSRLHFYSHIKNQNYIEVYSTEKHLSGLIDNKGKIIIPKLYNTIEYSELRNCFLAINWMNNGIPFTDIYEKNGVKLQSNIEGQIRESDLGKSFYLNNYSLFDYNRKKLLDNIAFTFRDPNTNKFRSFLKFDEGNENAIIKLIDTNLNILRYFKGKFHSAIDSTRFIFYNNSRLGIGKISNNLESSTEFLDIWPSNTGYYLCKKENLWYKVNQNLKISNKYFFEDVAQFESNFAIVSQAGKWKLLNLEDDSIIELIDKVAEKFTMQKIYSLSGKGEIAYSYLSTSTLNFFPFYTNNKDVQRKSTTYNTFNYIFLDFSSLVSDMKQYGFFLKKGNKIGVIDFNGDIITPFIYNGFSPFINGYALMQRGNKWGLINKYGQEVIPPDYEEIKYIDKELW